MKTVLVTPELIAEIFTRYLERYPEHQEGKVNLRIVASSFEEFEEEAFA